MSNISASRMSRVAHSYVGLLRRDPCSYCGKKPPKRVRKLAQRSTIDHIQPISKGGKVVSWSNMTAACGKCNRQRQNKSVLEFLMKRGGLR